MSTKTKTKTGNRTAGTLAVDRIEYRPTGERTANGKPIAAVYVDDVRVGTVAKANGSGWLFSGPNVEPPRFYLPSTKPEAAARLVDAAVAAGTIRNMDEEAATVAQAAGHLAKIVDSDTDRHDEDNLTRLMRAAGNLALRPGVRDGDYVTTPDGRTRRVGHLHDAHAANKYGPARPARAQLTNGGSWHLSENGGLSYSGGFDGVVEIASLVDTGETRLGSAWIWHHGRPTGGGGLAVLVPFRVFAVPTGVDIPSF